jgi:ankyrin repeat protein
MINRLNIFNKHSKLSLFILTINNTTIIKCGKIYSKLLHQPSLETQLSDAIKKQEVTNVQNLIEAGAKINSSDRHGRTKLMLSVIHNKSTIMQELLTRDANSGARTKDGKTALMYAAAQTPTILNQLLAHQSQQATANQTYLNMATRKGYTALMYATISGQNENVKTLIENRANIEAQSQQGYTPLMLAARHRQNQILIDLLNLGANPNKQDCQGQTALMHAVKSGNRQTVSTLLQLPHAMLGAQLDLDHKDEEGQSALSLALTKNKPEIYTQLKEAGANDQGLHEFGSVIFDLDNFNTYITMELTLQNEEPSQYINYLHHMFRISKATGRKYITKQEIVNWINGQLMLKRQSACAEIDEQDQEVVELRTAQRPFLVQKATAEQINTTVRLSDGNFATLIEPNLLKSLKYWRRQKMSDQQFNEFLAEGDKMINPIDGDQVLIPQETAAKFLKMQLVQSALPEQKYLTGAALSMLCQKKRE